MSTIERKDIIRAVLASRDDLDPGLDSELLEAIVNAEADSAGDGDAGLRATEGVVNAAIARGVGHVDVAVNATAEESDGDEA